MDTNTIEAKKALGNWKPNLYLSNLAVAYFEEPTYAHKRLFPICPVQFPSGHFYEFKMEDLARDNVQRKPDYGVVQPAIMGHSDNSYSCHVDQVLIGLDQIITLAYQRANAPGSGDPRRARVKMITEQMSLHQEIQFAEKFFKVGVWNNQWTGANTADSQNKKFKRFNNSDSDPVELFDNLSIEIRRNGRRKPNKLALGIETFKGLKNNPSILERIKYSGTQQNPAIVNENVLAQVFGVDEVIVLDATYNAAGINQPANMQYVCDSKGALLFFAPDTPQIDMPSAGYMFTWLMNGGNYIAIDQFEKNDGSHTDFLEGIIAYDLQKTSDALAVYLTDCVD